MEFLMPKELIVGGPSDGNNAVSSRFASKLCGSASRRSASFAIGSDGGAKQTCVLRRIASGTSSVARQTFTQSKVAASASVGAMRSKSGR